MSKNEKLFKLAQEYGWLSKMKEYSPIGGGWGKGMRSLLSGEYKEKVKLLEETDEAVRKILMGDNSYNHEIKDMLFYLEQAFLDKKHMDMAHYAAGLSKIVQKAISAGKDISNLSQEDLSKYFGVSQEEVSDYLSRADTETSMVDTNKADDVQNAIVSDIARGVEGLVNNLSISRLYRKFLSDPIEWLYKKETRERTRDAGKLLEDSKSFVKKILEIMDNLKTHRRVGDISNWVTEFSKLNELEKNYNKKQKEFYNKYIKPIMDQVQAARAKALEEEAAKKSEEAKQTEQEKSVPEASATEVKPTNNDVITEIPDLIPKTEQQSQQPDAVIDTDGSLVREDVTSPVITPTPRQPLLLDMSKLSPGQNLSQDQYNLHMGHLYQMGFEQGNEAYDKYVNDVLKEKGLEAGTEFIRQNFEELYNKYNLNNIVKYTTASRKYILQKFNTEFGNVLYKLAAQKADKEIIAALLVKHSDDIEDLDPEASLDLLKCAEKILNG
jgi:predicted transcriptional regulator